MITVLSIIVGLIAINLLLLRYSIQSTERSGKNKTSKQIDSNTNTEVKNISDAA